MRVIAGTAKRAVLTAPEGFNTRPTSDRAKESLFNILGGTVKGGCFLDLFSGSGAIGIEALSRGAKEAVFADSSKIAINSITANLAKTKLSHAATVLNMTAETAVAKLADEGRRFDIVFLDPPYGLGIPQSFTGMLSRCPVLADGAVLVLETDSRETEYAVPAFTLIDTRVYGRTCFLFYKAEAEL